VLATESFTATITAVGGKDLLEGRPVSAVLKPLKVRTLKKKPSSSKRRAGKRKR